VVVRDAGTSDISHQGQHVNVVPHTVVIPWAI
jgi:hypothetical protein